MEWLVMYSPNEEKQQNTNHNKMTPIHAAAAAAR
jgi:hypothetical protein